MSSIVDVGAQKKRIKRLLKQQNATLVAHYYTDALVQELAEETGGCVFQILWKWLVLVAKLQPLH